MGPQTQAVPAMETVQGCGGEHIRRRWSAEAERDPWMPEVKIGSLDEEPLRPKTRTMAPISGRPYRKERSSQLPVLPLMVSQDLLWLPFSVVQQLLIIRSVPQPCTISITGCV